MNDILTNIKTALAQFANAPDFVTATKEFLNVLGYHSERTLPPFVNVAEFLQTFPNMPKHNTDGEKRFIAAVKSVQIVFQLTDTEVKEQSSLIDSATFNQGDTKSFLFVAVQLKNGGHSRGKYAEWTREINKRFGMPVVVLFVCADANHNSQKRLTLAFVGRRKNMTNESRDVLQKVSLLREIHCTKPHRGHLDILAALSFDNRLDYIAKQKFDRNFDGLLKAWLHELDADALNKRFYDDLLEWFEFALGIDELKFPSPSKSPIRNEEHVIRIINRILFIWFLKEKGLVAAELFMEVEIKPLLKDYQRDGDSYYRAVLQNLFFATLNTQIMTEGKRHRRFRTDGDDKTRYNPQHKVFNFRRYKNLIAAPEQLEKYLDKSPFVNGGLFDCLDNEDKGADGRIDCFTDNLTHRKLLCVPNYLFFGKGNNKGLFDVLQKYKFTVEENTPIEQEVALDPELLGKVFENLLVYLNRKATGSYYTPREIVDYMVRESLLAHFCDKMQAAKSPRLTQKLQYLLTAETDYGGLSVDNKLDNDEIVRFIELIGELKLLDPAVGSGAFPMGVLSQLTMALIRIDPKNVYLYQREMQKAKTFTVDTIREQAIQIVEEVFSVENKFNNYGRKLSLIQNSIFGVDIQPAAVQICRLRFFIALAIEQIANTNADDNYGIRPLPNLETKIIAANTLIKLEPADIFRNSKEIKSLEEELQNIRREFFGATDRKTKKTCIAKDTEKRRKLSDKLKALKYPKGDAERIAKWDLYDQTQFADWFNAKWMFGADDGFDIIIGNPPYVDSENMINNNALQREIIAGMYESTRGNWDLFVPFIEHGINSVNGGIVSYIVPNKLLSQSYAKTIRNILSHNQLVEIRDYSHLQVFEASVCPIIFMVKKTNMIGKTKMTNMETLTETKSCNLHNSDVFRKNTEWSIYFVDSKEFCILEKINRINTKAIGEFSSPATVSDAYVIKDFLIDKETLSESKKLINSGTIDRYISYWSQKKTTYIKDKYEFPRVREIDIKSISDRRMFQSNSPKLIFANMTRYLECFLDAHAEYMAGKSTAIYISSDKDLHAMLAIFNSKLLSFWYTKTFHANKMGIGLQITATNLSSIPVPSINQQEQNYFSELAKKIITKKEKDSTADTSEWENEIDQKVYKLYGLTEEEIKIIQRT